MARAPFDFGIPSVPAEKPLERATDYERIENVPPGAFGAFQARGLEESGRSLEEASGQLAQTALRQQEFYNRAAIQQATNDYLDAGFNAVNQFRTLRGKDAMDAAQGAQQGIQQQLTTIRGGLHNDAQRLAFDADARRYHYYFMRDVSSWTDEQTKQYSAETARATIDNGIAGAGTSYNDPAQQALYLDHARKGFLSQAQINGTLNNPEIVNDGLRKIDSAFAIRTAQAMEEHGNDAQALEFLQNGTIPGRKNPDGTQGPPVPVAGLLDSDARQGMIERLRAKAKNAADDAYVNGLLGGGGAPGTPQGFQNNVGNIRTSAATYGGKGQPYKGFETFSTPEQGVAAAVSLLRSYAGNGSISLKDAVTRWAPPSENNTAAYIQSVSQATGLSPNEPLPLNDATGMAGVVKAMAHVEKGGAPFDDGVFQRGADMAINGTPASAAAQPAQSSPAEASFPDESALIQGVMRDFPDDTERQDRIIGKLERRVSILRAATATEREDLKSALPDLAAALEDGKDVAIPEDKIRRLYPPADAAHILETLDVSKQAGVAFNAVQWGSPDAVLAARQRLSAGMGPKEAIARKGEPGGVGEAESGSDQTTPEEYRHRQEILGRFDALVAKRNSDLAADPAGYVAGAPTVAAVASAVDQAKPDTLTSYANASLAMQDQLGVPLAARHILSKSAAQNLTEKLTQPGVDVKTQMGQLQTAWGDNWNHVFHDLVTQGKLPGAYQSVAVLPDPRDAALLARAINETSQGGRDWNDILGNAGGKSVAQTIRDRVRNDTEQVGALEHSLAMGGASAQQIDQIVGSIETLAYAKKFYNQEGVAQAADEAIRAFTDQYEFLPNGGARVPAAQAGDITQRAHDMLWRGDLGSAVTTPPGFTEGPDDKHPTWPTKEDYIQSLRSTPTWITHGNALWLMDNGGRIVRGTDGNPLSVPFNAPAISAAASPQPTGVRSPFGALGP